LGEQPGDILRRAVEAEHLAIVREPADALAGNNLLQAFVDGGTNGAADGTSDRGAHRAPCSADDGSRFTEPVLPGSVGLLEDDATGLVRSVGHRVGTDCG